MSSRLGWAAALAALAIAGCGGGGSGKSGKSGSSGKPATPSLPAFKAGFAHSQREFRQIGEDIAADIRGAATKSDAALAREFAGLATRARGAAGELAKLTPTAPYRPRLQSLVSGLDSVGDDLQQIATAAKRNDATQARAASSALLKHAATVKSLDTSLSNALGLSPP